MRNRSQNLLAVAIATVLLCQPATGIAGPTGPDAVAAARAFRSAHAADILRSYRELLAMPNLGTELEAITANAERIAALFRERGAEMQLLTLPDAAPLVVGRIDVPGATRTLGIYVHYDGQPPTGPDWVNPPYEPTLYSRSLEAGGQPIDWPGPGDAVDPEWRVYARSASDDKAPIPALLAALDALAADDLAITSNLVFLFEGEEELGSMHLPEYLDVHGDRFDVDLWLFCDGPVHQSGSPQIVFGVRGVTGIDLTVYGPARPLHSGHYGNWAPSPGQMLAELIASMKDDDGNVTVAGFYDSVAPLGRAEREAIDRLPVYDEELKRELGLGWTEGAGQTLIERLMLPSLNIRGLRSGDVGSSARNVIPDRAMASIDIRLVKGNDPEAMLDLVEAHIRAQGYHIVREDPDLQTRGSHPKLIKVQREGGYPAARTDMGLALAESVIEAVQAASERDVLLVPALGGSLPLYLFTDVLGKPAVILPIANHDNNQHASNENLRLANLWYGIDMYASVLTMR